MGPNRVFVVQIWTTWAYSPSGKTFSGAMANGDLFYFVFTWKGNEIYAKVWSS